MVKRIIFFSQKFYGSKTSEINSQKYRFFFANEFENKKSKPGTRE